MIDFVDLPDDDSVVDDQALVHSLGCRPGNICSSRAEEGDQRPARWIGNICNPVTFLKIFMLYNTTNKKKTFLKAKQYYFTS